MMKFLDLVKDDMQNKMGEDFEISVIHPTDNNIYESAIRIIKKGELLSLAFSMEDQYEEYLNGKKETEIADNLIKFYNDNDSHPNVDLSFLSSFQKAIKRVLYKVISYHYNRDILSKVPHVCFLDMAVVFYCEVPVWYNRIALVLIHDSHMELWGINLKKLYDQAMKNTALAMTPDIQVIKDRVLDRLMNVAQKIFEDDKYIIRKNWGPVYRISNEKELYGASVVLYPHLLGEFAEWLGMDLYLIPSSIHEMYIFPDNGFHERDVLLYLLQDFIDNLLNLGDILSSRIYYYERGNGLKIVE